jgi:hypothetical protein
MSKTLRCFVACVGALAFACTEDVDSNDVRTSGLYADMEVLATGNGDTTVSVALKPGGSRSNTYLVMEGEDELVASVDDEDRKLGKHGNYYETTFGTDAGETEFVVEFRRGPDDVDALDSHATLPEPFEIDDVPGSVSRADLLEVTWTPSGTDDDMTWELDGDCLFPNGDDMSDTGTLSLSAGDYDVHSGSEEETCDATLCLERTRDGRVDAEFGEGGVFRAIQRRCVEFSSTP